MNTPIHLPHYPTSQLRIHQFSALESGAALIVLGAVHGSEICGPRAIERIVQELDSGALQLVRGRVTFVPVTNPLAYQKGQRNGDRNLNRNLRPTATPQDYEDHIANVLYPLLGAHDVLLDLHSFQSQGEPFAMLGPINNTGSLEPFTHAAEEQALVLRLGVRRIMEGWLSTYAEGVKERMRRTQNASASERAQLLSTDPSYGIGTTETMRSQGGYALTLECGNHADPAALEVAYRGIRNTLAHLGLVDDAPPAVQSAPEFLRLAQVIDRLHVDDTFAKAWSSYDPLRAGDVIGTRHDGTPVVAPADGYIVFPNSTTTVGNEWFYFAQPSARDLGA